jgi:hypothetical protein
MHQKRVEAPNQWIFEDLGVLRLGKTLELAGT